MECRVSFEHMPKNTKVVLMSFAGRCILGEKFLHKVLLQGSDEIDQLTRIFQLCGDPADFRYRQELKDKWVSTSNGQRTSPVSLCIEPRKTLALRDDLRFAGSVCLFIKVKTVPNKIHSSLAPRQT